VLSERLWDALNDLTSNKVRTRPSCHFGMRTDTLVSSAEQQLVNSMPAEKGRTLLKDVRTHLIETSRPILERLIQNVTGVLVLSLHYDISTVTGEEVVLFTLAKPPAFRESKTR
jgi:uncharacterized protein YbcI